MIKVDFSVRRSRGITDYHTLVIASTKQIRGFLRYLTRDDEPERARLTRISEGRKTAGDFHEPLDLQRGSDDPSQDRGRGTRGWHRGGRPRRLRPAQRRHRLHADGEGLQGRQAGRGDELAGIAGSLKDFFGIHAVLTAPQLAAWICSRPNPKSTTENARSPRAFSFWVLFSAPVAPSRSACR